MRRALSRPAAAALLCLLAACGGSPDFFLLPPPEGPGSRLASPVGNIVVAEIGLPTYADALEIAVLKGTGELQLNSAASWADTPRRALTRHLAAALEERLTARVGTDPWPGYDLPGLRIEVGVDRLIGAPESSVHFSGQYFLIIPDSGTVTAVERFDIRVPPQGEGYPGLAAGHARAIERLADQIAARLTGRALPTS